MYLLGQMYVHCKVCRHLKSHNRNEVWKPRSTQHLPPTEKTVGKRSASRKTVG